MSPTAEERAATKIAEETKAAEAKKKTDAEKKGAGEKPEKGKLTYDTFVSGQSEEVKTLLEENVTGLKSALESERDARGDLEKKVREVAKEAEGEAKEKLEALANELKAADQKADFFVAAQAVGVSNLKLAYIVAIDEELFDRRGNVNFEKMKADYPELFGEKPKTPKGYGGSGQTPPDAGTDMNKRIRRKAGLGQQ